MAFIGLNVARDGSIPVEAIRDLRASWVRVVATPENDLTDYLKALRQQHIRVLLVFARESFAGEDNLRTYRDRYAGLYDAIQVGDLRIDQATTADVPAHPHRTKRLESVSFRPFLAPGSPPCAQHLPAS